ncbi:adenylate cyclase-associated CAP [Fadolivirus algeromassiliense]|jgi:hypothetical protein|uniref:Adenylate cyclase-associated CAP n=1 Tax=Fadolivirus FV1/VV64 TaxID=3070911 RepID=A0A7D3QVX9_9VIRU|nr:adenylate cyclase-associated CAP [Fadolivirus algeromassiliense]QKF94086.1 adenylate cyclase-associated CAP [Fadolivirus FV1/VV64]
MRHHDLEKKLKTLSEELDEYSFNIKYLNDNDKKEIKQLYTLLWQTYNQKIFIENISHANIRITDKIYINNNIYVNDIITTKTTLYFVNCNNVTVVVNNKVCHITIEHCNHFNIKTRGGSITGIDNINCKHVCHVLEKSSVYLLDISNSEGCTFYISEDNALDTIISSYGSPDIKIITTCPEKGTVKNKFVPSISFFEIYRLYSFEKTHTGLVQLSYVTPNYTSKKTVIAQK